MMYIKHNEIEAGLDKSKRVYLCGDLKKPSEIQYIPTKGYEIGISEYPTFTFEKAHVHTYNKEYNYVLEGSLKIYIHNNEIVLNEGDSIFFDSTHRHAMIALNDKPAKFLAVII